MRQRAGDRNPVVVLSSWITANKAAGSTLAGLAGSMGGNTDVIPRAQSKRAKAGSPHKSRSPGAKPRVSRRPWTSAANCPWVMGTPLGAPVEPEVNRIAAVSLTRTGCSTESAGLDSSSLASDRPSPGNRRPTPKTFFTERKALGKRHLARSARPTPIITVGAVRSSAANRRLRPMPGSARTGMAPRRKRPQVMATKSMPGGTNSATRSPGPTPSPARALAMRAVRNSNSPKVIERRIASLRSTIPSPVGFARVCCKNSSAMFCPAVRLAGDGAKEALMGAGRRCSSRNHSLLPGILGAHPPGGGDPRPEGS